MLDSQFVTVTPIKAMNIYFASLGCARNQVDSEIMCQQLRRYGFDLVDDPQQAEIIVVNTCSFIESAAQESIDTILDLASFKHKGNCRRLIVVGCLPERYRADISKSLPEVDVFIGTGGFDKLPEAVTGSIRQGTCLLPDPAAGKPMAGLARQPFARHQAYLKIAEGCNRHCTYCIIPRLRGPQRSFTAEDLQDEARNLIEQGAGEITLVAQETTAWGQDLDSELDFADLLDLLARLDQKVWIRFFYGHPSSFSSRIIEVVNRHSNLCPYFDLPIQHASDPVLKKMGRDYTRRKLEDLLELIRKQVPGAVLRTTVMTGFPGENDKDFETLAAFVERVKFDHLGVFIYSDADDLPSHSLQGAVPRDVALERYHRLMQRQQHISSQRNKRYNRQKLPVLIEDLSEDNIHIGRTMFQGPEVDGLTFVRIPEGRQVSPGEIVSVRIVDTLEYDLVGELA